MNTIMIVAKSGNREEVVKNILEDICDPLQQYKYWYGSGLWVIKIKVENLEEFDPEPIQGILEHGVLDFSMVFLNDELVDNTFVKHYDRYADKLFRMKTMNPNKGTIFNLENMDENF